MQIIEFANDHPLLAAEWDIVRNGPVPDTVQDVEWWMCDHSVNDRVWWKCKHDHRYRMTVKDRLAGGKCPHCNNKFNIVVAGENDLATTHPFLIKYWNYDKNSMLPSQISGLYKRAVWWKCDNNHVHADAVIDKVAYYKSGFLCQICISLIDNREALEKKWRQCGSEIMKHWDHLRNFVDPSHVRPADGQLFWWVCDNGHSFRATIMEWMSESSPCCICNTTEGESHEVKKEG